MVKILISAVKSFIGLTEDEEGELDTFSFFVAVVVVVAVADVVPPHSP